MIVVWGVGLGVYLVLGSRDLPGSKYLLNYAIWVEFLAHGVQMLIRALYEWETEKAHLHLWGSVTVRLTFGMALLVLKLRYDASPEMREKHTVMRLHSGPGTP